MIHAMLARIALAVLALVTGGFQVVDGVHVLVTGKYVGPETPGPWRHVIQAVGVDPFDFGPGFIALGVCWLTATAALLLTSHAAVWWALVATAALTLWYLPVGTVTALATIVVLVLARVQLTEAD
jgi:hypothetical protein